jgi:hypothetical protein
MSDVLRYGPEGPPPRKSTVVLTTAEKLSIERSPEIKRTGYEPARVAKARLKQQVLPKKKNRPSSNSGPHTVQGGLPELGRRR